KKRTLMKLRYSTVLFATLIFTAGNAQERMDFEKYEPTSTLVVPQHPVTRAKFPFIDVHNHQFRMSEMDLGTLIKEMDQLNMGVHLSLSRARGDHINQEIEDTKKNYTCR